MHECVNAAVCRQVLGAHCQNAFYKQPAASAPAAHMELGVRLGHAVIGWEARAAGWVRVHHVERRVCIGVDGRVLRGGVLS